MEEGKVVLLKFLLDGIALPNTWLGREHFPQNCEDLFQGGC